jgi:hypothetical protein
LRSFFSRHILKGFDPTAEDWMDALNKMPPSAVQEDKDAVIGRIRHLLAGARNRDKEKRLCGLYAWRMGGVRRLEAPEWPLRCHSQQADLCSTQIEFIQVRRLLLSCAAVR